MFFMNFAEKKEEMEAKYERAINAIAEANNVDVGVAFDMLEANVLRDGKYAIAPFGYVDVEEYTKDNAELVEE